MGGLITEGIKLTHPVYASKIRLTYEDIDNLFKNKLNKEDKEKFKNCFFMPLEFYKDLDGVEITFYLIKRSSYGEENSI